MSNNPIVDRAGEEGQIVGQHALSEQRLGDTRRESTSAVAISSSAAPSRIAAFSPPPSMSAARPG